MGSLTPSLEEQKDPREVWSTMMRRRNPSSLVIAGRTAAKPDELQATPEPIPNYERTLFPDMEE